MGWLKLPQAFLKLPGVLALGRMSYTFDGIPMRARRMPWKKRLNLLRAGMDAALQRTKLHSLPPTVQVEPANVCDLKCPLCPTGSGTMTRPRGMMSMETFQRILDELGDVLVTMILYCWGEPFLNEDLPRMIEAAAERGILTVTSTNGQCLQTMDEALQVVDAGLTGLVVAIDGSTQDVYETYRKSGEVDKVKRCAELVEQAKAQRRSALPYTDLRVVVMQQNEADIGNIERLAREFGFNMFSCKSLGCLKVKQDYGEMKTSPAIDPHPQEAGSLAAVRCNFPWRQPTVFWDGTLAGCEFDYELDAPFGHVGERPFMEMWNSPQAVAMRRGIRKGPRRPGFCDLCPYPGRGRRGTVLFCKELRAARARHAPAAEGGCR